MTEFLINIGYLIAAVLFILGLKGLTHPRTAVRGNLLGACGMFLAILITLTNRNIVSFEVILAGVIVGAAIGAVLAIKIKMTAMPELVALFNGFGGAASALVAGAALIESTLPHQDPFVQMTIATAASGLIGSVTFWGSLVAFGKLQGLIHENAILFTGQRALNAALGIFALGLSVALVLNPSNIFLYLALSTSMMGIPAIGQEGSVRARGFTTSLAPITRATSTWSMEGLISSILFSDS